MKKIVIIILGILIQTIFFLQQVEAITSADTFIENSEIPFGLSWKASSQQVNTELTNAGFVVWGINPKFPGASEIASTEELKRKLGITTLYYRNDNTIPVQRIYAHLYQGGLYSIVIRYDKASDAFKKGIKRKLDIQYFDAETDQVEINNVAVYVWKGERTIVALTYTNKNAQESYSNMTRLVYTDLITKQILGPNFPY
jgi:hypothetical protein